MKKRNKILALLLTLALLAGVLSVSALAVMNNDHDRISIKAGESVSVAWDEANYNSGAIVNPDSSTYYPSSFTLFVDRAASITMTGGAVYSIVEQTSGGTGYRVILADSAGAITIKLSQAAQTNDTYVLTFSKPMGAAAGGTAPSAFNKYLPLGQYASGAGWGSPYSDGTVLTGQTPKIVGGFSGAGVSLGAAGGYVQYEFANAIENDPKNPCGVDFIVYGNAFNGNPEAASVKVSADGNTWYELAGSLYYDDVTERNATVSYQKRADGIYYTLDGASWTKFTDKTAWWPEYNGEGYGNVYGGDGNGVLWSGDRNTITFSNVTLVKDTDATTDYAFGYADVHANGSASNYGAAVNPYTLGTGSGGDGYDLSWAVDNSGNPVSLSSVKYVRVYTSAAMKADGSGVFTTPGIFGETSAEVCGIYVTSNKAAGDVGTTDAPVVKNGRSNIIETTDRQVTETNYKTFSVTSSAENIFVNGVRITSGTTLDYSGITGSKLVQIIVQTGDKAPYVTLIKVNP